MMIITMVHSGWFDKYKKPDYWLKLKQRPHKSIMVRIMCTGQCDVKQVSTRWRLTSICVEIKKNCPWNVFNLRLLYIWNISNFWKKHPLWTSGSFEIWNPIIWSYQWLWRKSPKDENGEWGQAWVSSDNRAIHWWSLPPRTTCSSDIWSSEYNTQSIIWK